MAIEFVLDASALVELIIGPAPARELTHRTMTGTGIAPEVIDVESLQALRGLLRAGDIDVRAASEAVARAARAPVIRTSHRALLTRVWSLRDSVSAYDAAYIALAEQLDVPLLTCDARLGRAHGHDAAVIVYARS